MTHRGMTTRIFASQSSAWRRVTLTLGVAVASACSDGPSEPQSGSLVVNVVGLPDGTLNAVSVSGPQGGSATTRTVSVTDTLENLAPGMYQVTAHQVTPPSGTYAPSSAPQQVEVTRSMRASVTVAFEIMTGSIAVSVTGLPEGAPAAVNISGIGGYNRQLTATETLTGLQPGQYLISSNSVTEATGNVYSPSPIAQTISVSASETPRDVTARYALATGSLNVVVSGLPASVAASVNISGPAGYSRSLASSGTIVGLFPGSYAVSAAPVAGTSAYGPTVPAQVVQVSPSLTPTHAEVTYVELGQPPPPAFNVSVEGMYVTQAVQSFTGAVPLIAQMPGLARVFLKGSSPNTVIVNARLLVYNGESLQQAITLLPNVPGVPTAITEGTISTSWNAILPANLIQPGLRLVVEVDPSNAVLESNEADNRFPASGAFQPRVEVPPPLNLTVVPVLQSASGLTGSVSASSVSDYLDFTRKVMPIRDYRISMHEVFTSSAPVLESNDGNGGWFQVLGEINALRVAEGSNDYYLGFVGTTYNSGIVGLAFAPGRAAISWDKMPTAPRIAAHELGHNFGRLHAPCGGVGSPDPMFPHLFGTIGTYGYDITTGFLSPPGTSDLMGYCGFGWISDYTYTGILEHRAAAPNATMTSRTRSVQLPGGAARVQSLVVWGSIVDGKPTLEPVFTSVTRPILPEGTGPYRIEARASDGQTVFSYAFEGDEPADMPGRNLRHFAYAVPVSDAMAQQITQVTLTTTAGGRSELNRPTAERDVAVEARAVSTNSVQFTVSDPATLAVVRNRATGRIIAFVRGGGEAVLVRSSATEFDVQLSDGVRSRVRTIRPVRR
jgi:hypothetical protein